jgi:hypothetical protein
MSAYYRWPRRLDGQSLLDGCAPGAYLDIEKEAVLSVPDISELPHRWLQRTTVGVS